MRTLGRTILVLSVSLGTAVLGALAADAQEPNAPEPAADNATQIAGAVTPAPADLRDGASVLGYSSDGEVVTLRQGEGDLICLADKPGDERFHVACYYKQLDSFMARGRALRAEGKNRDEIVAAREAEIKAGTLTMPSQPTALYSLTGPAGSFDPETGEVSGVNRVYVVYIPYATSESTGLSPTPATGTPWLMAAGKPWAHIMLVQPAPEKTE